MNIPIMKGSARRHRGRARAALSLLLVMGIAGCDTLLEVKNPSSVDVGDLEDPALSQTLLNSALGQFECAYTSYVASTGVLASELVNASSWLNINGWGWRGVELETITGSCPSGRNASGLGAYTPLQQARYLAEDGIRLISDFPDEDVPGKDRMLGLLHAYAGYSWTLLGEGFCEMAVDQGPLMTPMQVMAGAEERFTSALALAQAAGYSDLEHMARVGRARARLNQGNLAGAASDAQAVPEGFVWYAEYSTVNGSRENRLFNMNRLNRFLSVDVARYGNLTLAGEPDPRVSMTAAGAMGHDGLTPHYYQDKYPTAASDIPIASWEEAQLIMAEADPSQAVAAINRLRSAQGLPAYTGDGNLDDVLEERRRQLFLEGHRLNDMLRHDLEFPTGLNHKGQSYGPITCMPLPEQEKRNNPNLS